MGEGLARSRLRRSALRAPRRLLHFVAAAACLGRGRVGASQPFGWYDPSEERDIQLPGSDFIKATWKNQLLAESDDTVVVEGNHYFSPTSIDRAHFEPSDTTTVCPWKGTASYYNVVVDGETNADAAWYYPEPKPAASEIKDQVAFWKGVTVES